VGTRSLADRVPLPPSEAAGLLAATAEIVADLHGHGIVHGALEPTQVLLDPDGRPVLCGFGTGGNPSDDVDGLGRMVQAALGTGDEVDPNPERRFGRRSRAAAFTRRAPLSLADQATADDPTCRPSARSFARARLAAAPGAALPAAASVGDVLPPDEHRRVIHHDPFAALRASGDEPDGARRRWAPWIVGAAVGLFVVVALLGGSNGGDHNDASANAPAPTTVAGPTTTRGSGLPVVTTTVAPVSAAGATEPPVVKRDGARYAVGEAGDQAEVGDWACTGQATVALLRPSTGEVFVRMSAAPVIPPRAAVTAGNTG
jgi:hypothetical protein